METIKELEELKCRGECMHTLCDIKRAEIRALKDVLKLIDEWAKRFGIDLYYISILKQKIQG